MPLGSFLASIEENTTRYAGRRSNLIEPRSRDDLLELERGDLGRKAADNAGHLPRAQRIAGSAHSAALGLAVMLPESSYGIRSRADVEIRVSDS